MRSGAKVIVETDDDNHPKQEFWALRKMEVMCRRIEVEGWVNAYRYFTKDFINPRGLPLNHARDAVPEAGQPLIYERPIQQGLADNNVDAVYRKLFPLPFDFEIAHDPIGFGGVSWCPFNNQNTTFFKSAFPTLYLGLPE